jgi:hypothetical protein
MKFQEPENMNISLQRANITYMERSLSMLGN